MSTFNIDRQMEIRQIQEEIDTLSQIILRNEAIVGQREEFFYHWDGIGRAAYHELLMDDKSLVGTPYEDFARSAHSTPQIYLAYRTTCEASSQIKVLRKHIGEDKRKRQQLEDRLSCIRLYR